MYYIVKFIPREKRLALADNINVDRLAPFDIKEVREITSYDELDLGDIGRTKTALFVIISDMDDFLNFLVSIMYTQLFNLLCIIADDEFNGRLALMDGGKCILQVRGVRPFFSDKVDITKYKKNSNLPHGHGELQLNKFEPFPKNPPISKVFREIGYADELGSGMRNTNKYTKLYSGGTPVFIEDNIFEIQIPIANVAGLQVGPEEKEKVPMKSADKKCR